MARNRPQLGRIEQPPQFATGCLDRLVDPMEDLLKLSGGRAWFQLYVAGNTQEALSLSQRAANCRRIIC
jgi:hypothetical protein